MVVVVTLRFPQRRASDILRKHKNGSGLLYGTGMFYGGYVCEMRFSKPFEDKAKLETLFFELIEQSGQISQENALIQFKDEVSQPFPQLPGALAGCIRQSPPGPRCGRGEIGGKTCRGPRRAP